MLRYISKMFGALLALTYVAPYAQGFKIQNGALVDANCRPFVIKGINVPLAWYQTDVLNNISNIKTNSGANCLRLVVGNGYTPLGGTGQNWSTPDNVWQQATERCIQNNMIPMLEVHNILGSNNTTDLQAVANWWASKASYLTQPNIAKYLLINIANEWGDWFMSSPNHSPAQTVWRDAYIQAIQTIRNAGIKTTLVVDAPGYGQDYQASTLLNHALAVLNADPEKNVLFSLHMYCEWKIGGNSPISLLTNLKNAGIPVIVGEFADSHPEGNSTCYIDADLIMSTCHSNGQGWLAWSWKGNGGGTEALDMAVNWSGTQLTSWGNKAINGAHGTKTAVNASVFTGASSLCTGGGSNIGLNIIRNGEFDQGTNFWQLENNNGGNGSMSVVQNGNLSGSNSLRVCAINPGSANWHVQVNQHASLEAGKTYRISFMARADAARPLAFGLQQEGGSWTNHYSNQINLTTSSQSFSFSFSPAVTDPSAKLKFYVGNNTTCLYIDKVEFLEVPTITANGATTFCQGGNVILGTNAETGLTFQWKRDGDNISNATTSTYTVTQSGNYSVVAISSRGGVESFPTSVNVNAIPAAPLVTTPVNYCQNAAANPLTATGNSLRWYITDTGGNASTTAPTPNTATVGTTNHFVSQTVNGCESPRAQIAVNVNATQRWYADEDRDGFGDAAQLTMSCEQPSGYVSNAQDKCPTDPAKINPGSCGCNKSETECLDCKGTPNGNAFIDNCNLCVSDESEACVLDCFGTFGGSAFVDSCGVCASGLTGMIPILDKYRCVTVTSKNSKGLGYWEVTPNPYQETAKLSKAGGKGIYKVYDLSGLELEGGSVVEEVELGKGLKLGIYFLLIEDVSRRQLFKLVKE